MTQERSAEIPGAIRAEAAVWVARLHSSGRSASLEAGLRKWLKADPLHARAFEIATEAWDLGGNLAATAGHRMPDRFASSATATAERRRRFLVSWPLAAAASVLIVFLASLFYLHQRSTSVATGVGEQHMLTLSDGTRIFLNTNSRLFVRDDAAQRRVELASGEALFDVVKDHERPFVVAVGDRQVVALGTEFVVRRDPQQVSVTLMEGKVTVSPIAQPAEETTLSPGQRLTLTGRDPPRLDQPTIDQVLAWRRGEIVLDRTRLRDAVSEMNRYSSIQLIVADQQVADISVSGIFRTGDSARFAHAVGETYHLAVVRNGERIVISRRTATP